MVEYWKEQDAFYRPIEFGLYNPYEVSEKFVEPVKGATFVPVTQENAAPEDSAYVVTKYFGLPVNNPLFWVAVIGIGGALIYMVMKR